MKVVAEETAREIADPKKSYAEWETKFLEVSVKRAELEKFVEDFGLDLVGKLKGGDDFD